MKRKEGVGRVLQKEGGCGRREDRVGEGGKGEREGEIRSLLQREGGRNGGYYKGSIDRWKD